MTFAIKKRINTTAKNKAALACLNEYYDFKAFTRVLWQFMTKFAPSTCVFWCARCNTPESGWIQLKVGIQSILFLLGKILRDTELFILYSNLLFYMFCPLADSLETI